MSLLFFLSGLFVWPSLQRKRAFGYARDRLARLGIPFVFGVLVLVPITIYPAYLATTENPSVADYAQRYVALPFVPNGQLWFLWQLLALNFIAAFVYPVAPNSLRVLGRWSGAAGRCPGYYFVVLVAVSAVAYVPLALVFTQWAWSDSGVLAVQWCRPLLYAVYFFAGVGIGTAGIDVGLIAADGTLARRWYWWLAAAIASLFGWMGTTSLTLAGPAPVVVHIAADSMFVVACACGCFFLIAASLRFGLHRSSMRASLSANAYSIYLVHYVFVVWLQYALLTSPLFALFKGAIVFGITLVLSWLTVLGAQRIPFGSLLLAAPARAPNLRAPPSTAGYVRLRQIDSQ